MKLADSGSENRLEGGCGRREPATVCSPRAEIHFQHRHHPSASNRVNDEYPEKPFTVGRFSPVAPVFDFFWPRPPIERRDAPRFASSEPGNGQSS